jgi:hypothetical protein
MSAIEKRSEDELVGRTEREVGKVNALLKRAESECNLVAPATRVGSVPEGFGVALSVVYVDTRVDDYGSGDDVFRVDGGKVALLKHKLDQIGAALGLTWDPQQSGRLDDGKTLYYWHFRAVGSYVSFDMQRIAVKGEYEFDMREGSPRCEELLEKVNYAKAGSGKTLEQARADALYKAQKSIRQMRKFGLRRAETGARTAAIAELGLKRAGTPDEMAKPWVVAKLQFTGQSEDPEMRKALTLEGARAFLGGGVTPQAALFGNAPALPATTRPGAVIDEQPDEDEPDRPSEPPPAAAKAEPAITLRDRNKTPLRTAPVELLEYWHRRLEDDLLDNAYPGDEEREADIELRDHVTEELKRRGAGEKY